MVEELSFYQVTNRLARLLNQLPLGQISDPKGQQLTKVELAARLGSDREVDAHSQKEMERSNAIQVNRGRIQIVDWATLQQWGS